MSSFIRRTLAAGAVVALALTAPQARAEQAEALAAPAAASDAADLATSSAFATFVKVNCFRPWLSNTLEWGGESAITQPGMVLWVGLFHRGRLVDSLTDNTVRYTARKSTAGVDGSGAWEVRAIISKNGMTLDNQTCIVT